MFSHFFIDRPIFATVLSVVIVIVGAVALLALPIAQYPEVTPPSVSVSASYPGASAQVVADTFDPRQGVLDLNGGVIAQVQLIVAAIR